MPTTLPIRRRTDSNESRHVGLGIRKRHQASPPSTCKRDGNPSRSGLLLDYSQTGIIPVVIFWSILIPTCNPQSQSLQRPPPFDTFLCIFSYTSLFLLLHRVIIIPPLYPFEIRIWISNFVQAHSATCALLITLLTTYIHICFMPPICICLLVQPQLIISQHVCPPPERLDTGKGGNASGLVCRLTTQPPCPHVFWGLPWQIQGNCQARGLPNLFSALLKKVTKFGS